MKYKVFKGMYENVISHYLTMMNKLLDRPRYRFSEDSENVPPEPGVYVIHDEKEKALLYSGRTKNLRRRLLGDHRRGNAKGSQFRRALGQKLTLESEMQITRYIAENCCFQFIIIKELEEMIRLEHFTTAVLGSLLNTRLKR